MLKIDVLLRLMSEIDEICEEKNLKYTVYGKTAVQLIKDNKIDEKNNSLTIAMTQGDAEKLEREIRDKIKSGRLKNRYIESYNSNSNFTGNYMMYGDLNTVIFDINDLKSLKSTNRIHNCLSIGIAFIEKDVLGMPSRKKKRCAKMSVMQIESRALWYVKFAINVMNFFIKPLKGGNFMHFNHMQHKERFALDSWADIYNYETVKIRSKVIPAEIFYRINRVNLISLSLNLIQVPEEYIETVKKGDININANVSSYSTYMSFEEYKNNNQIQQLNREIRCLREEVMNTRKNTMLLRRKIKRIRNVVEMSRDKIQLGSYYETIQADIFKENDFEQKKLLMKPYTDSLKYFEKKNITYSINEKLDNLAYDILISEGLDKRVKHISKLKKQQYFIK